MSSLRQVARIITTMTNQEITSRISPFLSGVTRPCLGHSGKDVGCDEAMSEYVCGSSLASGLTDGEDGKLRRSLLLRV
jgi:hypothetical protein